jgi:hypothetical protein
MAGPFGKYSTKLATERSILTLPLVSGHWIFGRRSSSDNELRGPEYHQQGSEWR